ncbi:MAG: DUF481 domain-containing protein [Cyclobacteriaceae bacterium]|nr:DUF481 domain-containing protein [Cyclobacteriaceae bacterium]
MKLIQLVAFLLLISTVTKASKSDTITLFNGDKITCEVKSLSKGKLYVKTDDMGKLYIKWVKIAHIETKGGYEITFKDHSSIYGSLSKSGKEGYALVRFGIFQDIVPLENITSMVQINSSFLKQLSGNFDAGYSYTNGNQTLQFNSTGEIRHRSKKILNKINYDAVISDNPQAESRKQSSGYTLQAFFKHSFFTIYNISWEQNTELGIENRVLTNARVGYSPIDNSTNRLDLSAGVLINREFSNEQGATNNGEGIVAITYNLFVFTKPDIDITTTLIAYPSFTVKDRVRSDLNFQMRWKVFSNFTLNFKYYFNYDSDPPSIDALQFDYGVNTSIGYSF